MATGGYFIATETLGAPLYAKKSVTFARTVVVTSLNCVVLCARHGARESATGTVDVTTKIARTS